MSESGASEKLRPDGERILPENDSAAELFGRYLTFHKEDFEEDNPDSKYAVKALMHQKDKLNCCCHSAGQTLSIGIMTSALTLHTPVVNTHKSGIRVPEHFLSSELLHPARRHLPTKKMNLFKQTSSRLGYSD